ncbi:MAG TPA: hypothetical protein VMV48_11430 [Gallionellaceae bacterium]|nr:hypothetical protein [Gallionellaceae bacterium]
MHKKHFFGAVRDRADYASAVKEMFGRVMVKFCVFDASQHCRAHNDMPYVNAQGELKRIDKLVEFENEVWIAGLQDRRKSCPRSLPRADCRIPQRDAERACG